MEIDELSALNEALACPSSPFWARWLNANPGRFGYAGYARSMSSGSLVSMAGAEPRRRRGLSERGAPERPERAVAERAVVERGDNFFIESTPDTASITSGGSITCGGSITSRGGGRRPDGSAQAAETPAGGGESDGNGGIYDLVRAEEECAAARVVGGGGCAAAAEAADAADAAEAADAPADGTDPATSVMEEAADAMAIAARAITARPPQRVDSTADLSLLPGAGSGATRQAWTSSMPRNESFPQNIAKLFSRSKLHSRGGGGVGGRSASGAAGSQQPLASRVASRTSTSTRGQRAPSPWAAAEGCAAGKAPLSPEGVGGGGGGGSGSSNSSTSSQVSANSPRSVLGLRGRSFSHMLGLSSS